jgi:hypothetical protein
MNSWLLIRRVLRIGGQESLAADVEASSVQSPDFWANHNCDLHVSTGASLCALRSAFDAESEFRTEVLSNPSFNPSPI